MIFHLVDATGWALALQRSEVRPTAGPFVHLSTRAQVLGSANRFFKGRTDVLLLRVDETRLTEGLKYEEGEPGQLFPHFYGALPVAAVLKAVPLTPNAEGNFLALEGIDG